ncbi:hypothetical protein L4X63_12850 [Geomonas sp. Red32]|uniref:hypothetical protein n=1 Tax=Geomonas sp. Red32 TaxID=2912856 RepID=UPI00202CFE25|nr:hypothetical protein [Geomonas sp. Red32]MCM0082480.1 hypothetical protein [Geomonas sp. Red32]
MLKQIDRMPVWFLMLAAFVLVALLGYVDFLTGDYSILIFYVVPIFIVAWGVGRWGAVAIAVAAGIARVVSDFYSYSDSQFRYWNSLQDTAFLIMVGVLVALVKKLLSEEER